MVRTTAWRRRGLRRRRRPAGDREPVARAASSRPTGRCRPFNDGARALAAMPRAPPDVVLSRLQDAGHGRHRFPRASVRAAHPDAVLILLTGYADKESAIRAINEVGIWQYVEKPWDLGDLLLKIRQGLERRELVGELQRKNRDARGAARRARARARASWSRRSGWRRSGAWRRGWRTRSATSWRWSATPRRSAIAHAAIPRWPSSPT